MTRWRDHLPWLVLGVMFGALMVLGLLRLQKGTDRRSPSPQTTRSTEHGHGRARIHQWQFFLARDGKGMASLDIPMQRLRLLRLVSIGPKGNYQFRPIAQSVKAPAPIRSIAIHDQRPGHNQVVEAHLRCTDGREYIIAAKEGGRATVRKVAGGQDEDL